MGIKFKCKIKGLDNLERKINKIVTKIPKNVEESIEDILKNIQGQSIKFENAEFKTRNENKKIIQKKLKQLFEEVCK